MSDKDEVKAPEGNVVLSKNEFSALMERIDRLENPGVPRRTQRVRDRIATLRTHNDELVIGVGKALPDHTLPETHRDYLSIELTTVSLEGKQKKQKVNYLDFMANDPKVAVKLTRISQETRIETEIKKGGGGVGSRRLVDKEGRYTDIPGDEMEFEVEYTDYTITAEVLEGDYVGKTFTFTPEQTNALNA